MLKYPRVATHQPIGQPPTIPVRADDVDGRRTLCGGSTTRNIPWLNELVPEPVLEMPVTLGAKARGEIGGLGPGLFGAR